MAKLFFSYSHKDESLRNELETHLALLKRQGIISAWHDRRIRAGDDFAGVISEQLESADIILLLVSANFLASEYCFEIEMRRALEKHKEGGAVIIPVIVHPCDWQSAPFGHLQATPTDGKPISMHANLHEALATVAKDVREVAEKLMPMRGFEADTSKSRESGISIDAEDSPRSSNLRIKGKFDDHERDKFLEDGFEYIARFFEASLQELSERNKQIKVRFKRVDEMSFSAWIYEEGERVAECSIWYGGGHFGSNGIYFSYSSESGKGSYNESMSVCDDGYTLQLRPFGMQLGGRSDEEVLSQQGAAEYFWAMLIRPLQE